MIHFFKRSLSNVHEEFGKEIDLSDNLNMEKALK
jgi:hypothetical protein